MSISRAQPTKIAHGTTRRFATGRAVAALILREMATRYGRSPGGYAWAVLEPLGGIMVLGFGMALLIRTPALGSSFVLFFATGFLVFSMYQQLANEIGRCINFSRSLLFYPAVTWVDAVLARLILAVLTNIVVMVILFTGVILMTDTNAQITLGPIAEAVMLTALAGLAIGVLNCVLLGLFDAWMQVWSIINKPLFFVSGTFFLYEDMPGKLQNILWWNPLLHISGLMRRGFYSTYEASYVSVGYVCAVSGICLFFGIILMSRYHRVILNR